MIYSQQGPHHLPPPSHLGGRQPHPPPSGLPSGLPPYHGQHPPPPVGRPQRPLPPSQPLPPSAAGVVDRKDNASSFFNTLEAGGGAGNPGGYYPVGGAGEPYQPTQQVIKDQVQSVFYLIKSERFFFF